MVDGFNRLRHDAVIRRHNQNSDIRGICAPHSHGRERLMAGCVEECDRPVIIMNHRSTDVLCDSAGFAVCDMGVADRVQKGRLTMVDMTHYTDDGRP